MEDSTSGAEAVDLDRFGDHADFEADAQVQGLIDLELDAGEYLLLEATGFGGYRVVADMNVGHAELAALVGPRLPRFGGGNLKDRDLCVRYDGAGGVLHKPDDGSGCYLSVQNR